MDGTSLYLKSTFFNITYEAAYNLPSPLATLLSLLPHSRCSLVSLLSISQPCRHLFSHQGFVTIISFSLHLPKDFSSSSEKQHVVVIIFSGKFFSTSYQTLLPVWVRCLTSVLPWQLGLPQHHIYPGLLLAICFSIILAR